MVRILFVCLGNICRSPTAEGVMRSLLHAAAMEREVLIDSAGTGAWHIGSAPDSRAAAAAGERGIGGGDINEAYRLVLAGGREAFVKTRSGAHPGEYALEAEALVWLAEPGAVRTPRVLEVDDSYLVLEWVAPGSLGEEGAEE